MERIERIPYEREIVEYEEVVHNERIPIERTITDYYAVETQIEYIPKEIEETIVEYEPVERTWERVQYLPVETQIVHYPEHEKQVVRGQGQIIQGGYTSSSQVKGSYVTGQTVNYVSGGSRVENANYATSSYAPVGGYQSSSAYQTGGSQYHSGA